MSLFSVAEVIASLPNTWLLFAFSSLFNHLQPKCVMRRQANCFFYYTVLKYNRPHMFKKQKGRRSNINIYFFGWHSTHYQGFNIDNDIMCKSWVCSEKELRTLYIMALNNNEKYNITTWLQFQCDRWEVNKPSKIEDLS